MTFCVGIKVESGLVALADTEIVKGGERLSKGKLSMLSHGGGYVWIMTSGLRSVRDKTLTYTENVVAESGDRISRMYEIANLFGEQLRRVRQEDGDALARSNLHFNLHAIIGGRLEGDEIERMYYVYPEGNWIEVNADSPYFLIGRTYYAKPILDRLLTWNTGLPQAAALAFLGFDATRASVVDVGFPIDLIVSEAMTRRVTQHRFTLNEMEHVASWWQNKLKQALDELPMDWFNPLANNTPVNPTH